MVTNQKNGGDVGFRKPHQPATPFALKSRRGRAVFVGVAGKNDQVHFFSDGSLDDGVKRTQKVHHAFRETGFGVVLSEIGHVDVGVSKMKDFYHGLIITMPARALHVESGNGLVC